MPSSCVLVRESAVSECLCMCKGSQLSPKWESHPAQYYAHISSSHSINAGGGGGKYVIDFKTVKLI